MTCVSVAETTQDKMVNSIVKALGVSNYVEARLDYLEPESIAGTLDAIKEKKDKLICTVRPETEGGKFQGNEDERIDIICLVARYKPFLLDVEYETLHKNPNMVKRLEALNAKLLVSWHDFNSTPDIKYLTQQMNAMSHYSRWIKIVCMAKTVFDTTKILKLYEMKDERDTLISFSMGCIGSMTRVMCLYAGSPYTYVTLGEDAIAPGQISVKDVKMSIDSNFFKTFNQSFYK